MATKKNKKRNKVWLTTLSILSALNLGLGAFTLIEGQNFVSSYEKWKSEIVFQQGEKGETGATGATGANGKNGKSAYQIWLDNGNTGSEADFLSWLKGEAGKDGVSVEKVEIDENGDLIVYFSNGQKQNAGNVLSSTDAKNVFSELTYVAFGDSITYGIDGVNGGRMVSPYPTLVAESLDFAKYENRAVSGATFCENTLGRTNMTKAILSFQGEADIISVMLGVNDYAVSLSLGTVESRDNTTIYGSLYLICEYFTEYYADSFVFFMTPFPYKKGTNTNNDGYVLEDVVEAIKYMSNKYDIPVLDTYAEGEFETEMNLPESDGLHPSQQFFEQYTAPQIVRFIKNNYK